MSGFYFSAYLPSAYLWRSREEQTMPDNAHTKFLLNEDEMPRTWYNIMADLPNPQPPVLHPGTKHPVTPDDLASLFPIAWIMQEENTDRYIEINQPKRQRHIQCKPPPLFLARRSEKQ